jgi:hypothetical protein
LKVTAEGSRLLASGTVEYLTSPVFKGNYDFLLDLTQVGAVARQPQLKAGKLSLTGSGFWSSQTFSSSGALGLRDLVFRTRLSSVKEASATGNFSVDPQRITLRNLEAS